MARRALDPAGGVRIIDMARRSASQTATLTGVVETGSHLLQNTGMDIEPASIAVGDSGARAFATLREANAVGGLNLQNGTFEQVVGLGVKDFNAQGNRIDPLNNGNAAGTSGHARTSVNIKGCPCLAASPVSRLAGAATSPWPTTATSARTAATGAEPESVEILQIGGRSVASVGLAGVLALSRRRRAAR